MGVKERPILFSAPMVRAILDGRKTQTRRVVKPQPQPNGGAGLHPVAPYRTPQGDWAWVLAATGMGSGDTFACPYGQPGDRLWVRETWRVRGGQEYEYQRDRSQVMYRATHEEDGYPLGWESYDWHPSIFMPRWASRITLEITGVRVERLNDISEADAMAEGITSKELFCAQGYAPKAFRKLWESINGPGSFDSRWVWVLEFRRIDA